MPRLARLDLPDLLQHVIVRGVNGSDIFADDDDRRWFLQRLSGLLTETQTECFAWALMSNHLHLLLRPRRATLAHLMRRLLTGYAISFNRRHNRTGHLFQNRYKSIACEENSYLLELIRYIHLNPLRGGLVDDLAALDTYPWCGHAVLMGQARFEGQLVGEVLGLFAEDAQQGRVRYRAFVADGLDLEAREDLVGKRPAGGAKADAEESFDSRILGGQEFVEQLHARQVAIPRQAGRVSLEGLVQRVCEYYGVNSEDLQTNTRAAQIVKARSVISYLAVRQAGYSGVKVGERINLGRAGVSRAAVRGEAVVRKNLGLLGLVDE
ncbi:transposase [Geoalkalibacter halelectricus]|uniref:Transposase n=1 Tax=Geoalkalibacter halelectricus TaxID=2847045 RepID=A0ABY5ZRU8_9BACT|nr:transposase [Geoalkalibacter halelectricus]MDO3378736.1 transposase [Geoalkalibacter halelectricus]UWZ79956.1 transposase [Geoalkalibacter halelectricus]